jgi:hypothetical protein
VPKKEGKTKFSDVSFMGLAKNTVPRRHKHGYQGSMKEMRDDGGQSNESSSLDRVEYLSEAF